MSPLATQRRTNAKAMLAQCGRGKNMLLRQGGQDGQMMLIDFSSPASPLHFMVFSLFFHGVVGARRVMGGE